MSAALTFRPVTRADVPAVVALLADDVLGRGRESAELAPYLAAFDAMQAEGGNQLIVGEAGDQVLATYQLTVISGLSLSAARRAQIEAVRAAGASLMQLTSNASRTDAHRFYERLGYAPSHIGFKKPL